MTKHQRFWSMDFNKAILIFVLAFLVLAVAVFVMVPLWAHMGMVILEFWQL